MLARIDSLAVPPAWRDVSIAAAPSAKVQARGRDAAGRTQAIYHPEYRRAQEQKKFDRLARFGKQLPRIRGRVGRDIKRRGLSEERVVAWAVRLLDQQLFRVGNDRYAREHGSYGLTTLRSRHVRVSGSTVLFDYPGKSGQRQRCRMDDARLAAFIGQVRRIRTRALFTFVDSAGDPHRVDSDRVNAYIKRSMGEEFSAKDFRTWGGTLLAFTELLQRELPERMTDREAKRAAREVTRVVADRLGNTPAVARASYIDPRVWDLLRDRPTLEALRSFRRTARARRGFSADEQCLMRMLGPATRQ